MASLPCPEQKHSTSLTLRRYGTHGLSWGTLTAGGGVWTHVVSKDLAHWAHIPDALDAGPHNSTWDKFGPCDGTVSFPNGPYGFDGECPRPVRAVCRLYDH